MYIYSDSIHAYVYIFHTPYLINVRVLYKSTRPTRQNKRPIMAERYCRKSNRSHTTQDGTDMDTSRWVARTPKIASATNTATNRPRTNKHTNRQTNTQTDTHNIAHIYIYTFVQITHILNIHAYEYTYLYIYIHIEIQICHLHIILCVWNKYIHIYICVFNSNVCIYIYTSIYICMQHTLNCL